MTLREVWSRADALQRTRAFKVGASIAVVAAAIVAFAVYFIVVTAPGSAGRGGDAPAPDAGAETAPAATDGTETVYDAGAEAVRRILAAREDPTGVGIGLACVAGLALGVIWLGLGITYLVLGVCVLAVAYPLSLVSGARGLLKLVTASVGLTAAFVALLELFKLVLTTRAGLRLLGAAVWGLGEGVVFVGAMDWILDQSGALQGLLLVVLAAACLGSSYVFFRWWLAGARVEPIAAIARNTLTEAVRLKVSLVFIVLLILGLASLPGMLDAGSPLRYRVQTFLSYGTGGTFWVLAMLTLVFSVGTVAFEQRARVIWQTMTKPVAAWQYLLGKWVGVCAMNAVLLAVSGTGVFLFTEYLRGQPAVGESRAFVVAGEEGAGRISEDRLVLETQVLAARVTVPASDPPLDRAAFDASVEERIQAERRTNEYFEDSPASRRKVRADLYTSFVQAYRTIAPGDAREYVFEGLKPAKDRGVPVTLRYKINAGSNRPDILYKLTISVSRTQGQVREAAPGQWHTIPLVPDVISDEGVMSLFVVNGELQPDGSVIANPQSIHFPPDGLEVSYSAGSYRMNFARVVGVLWVKLAFLAMLGLVAATFLSFPVACLVAFGCFFAAEASAFLGEALEYFSTEDHEGDTIYFQVVVAAVSQVVTSIFEVYGHLRPTGRLVEGRLLSWSDVATGTLVLSAWTGVIYACGVVILRRRELAMYSGQ